MTKLCNCGIEFTPSGFAQKRCAKCRTTICIECKHGFMSKNSRLDQKFCSRSCKDKSQTGKEPIHLSLNRGRKPRTYHLRKREKHGNAFDRAWRKLIFERDGYKCVKCGSGGRLQADHIKPYKAYPSLRHVLSNGRTLCIPCHKKTPTYGWSGYWTQIKQIAAKRLSQEVFDFNPKQETV